MWTSGHAFVPTLDNNALEQIIPKPWNDWPFPQLRGPRYCLQTIQGGPRRSTIEEIEKDHRKGINIHSLVVVFMSENFWRHVAIGTSLSCHDICVLCRFLGTPSNLG